VNFTRIKYTTCKYLITGILLSLQHKKTHAVPHFVIVLVPWRAQKYTKLPIPYTAKYFWKNLKKQLAHTTDTNLCHSIISINHQSISNEEGHTSTCHCMEVNHYHIVCFHNMDHCSSISKLFVNNRDSIFVYI
jgi:hypothetical protein